MTHFSEWRERRRDEGKGGQREREKGMAESVRGRSEEADDWLNFLLCVATPDTAVVAADLVEMDHSGARCSDS